LKFDISIFSSSYILNFPFLTSRFFKKNIKGISNSFSKVFSPLTFSIFSFFILYSKKGFSIHILSISIFLKIIGINLELI